MIVQILCMRRYQFFFLTVARGLIEKMQGLETYPAQYRNQLNGTEDEYEHAAKYLASKDESNPKCGTLSRSEWEAACKCFI